MNIKGDLKPIQQFLAGVFDAISESPIARSLSKAAAKRYEDNVNRQGFAARDALTDDLYPELNIGNNPDGRRPLKRRYTWKDGTSGHKFPSSKAQAYFFAVVLPSGQVPYMRTGNLRDSIRGEVEDITTTGYAIRYSVDLRQAPYAEYVIGGNQYYYHGDTGWPTLAQSVRAAFEDDGKFATLAQPYLDILAGYIVGEAGNE